jgi:hypothetical protein
MKKPKQSELFPEIDFGKMYIKEQMRELDPFLKEMASKGKNRLSDDELEDYYEQYRIESGWWIPHLDKLSH